jgi:hypothetical protein
MARKHLSELILPEVTMLEVAARLFAVLREHMAHPPPPSTIAYWNAKVDEELVRHPRCIQHITINGFIIPEYM